MPSPTGLHVLPRDRLYAYRSTSAYGIAEGFQVYVQHVSRHHPEQDHSCRRTSVNETAYHISNVDRADYRPDHPQHQALVRGQDTTQLTFRPALELHYPLPGLIAGVASGDQDVDGRRFGAVPGSASSPMRRPRR
jgi:hypothetical protein